MSVIKEEQQPETIESGTSDPSAASASTGAGDEGDDAGGLSSTEAEKRRRQYGYNEIAEEEFGFLAQFFRHFWGPIPWMIEAAALLSALVRDWADFVIILALLVANGIVGFWEEYQAGNAIAALKARLALHARVRRDGAWQNLPARELVPGDVIRVRLGDIVPADIQLLDGDPLEVDQSALTGESLPVTRQGGEALYSGSIIRRGEIDGIVRATGSSTYFGKTAQLVESTHAASHFQQAVLKIGDYLIALALVLVILILMVALFRGDSGINALRFALVLTVASIPVAMPTVLSVTMAAGAQSLAGKQAVVRRLAAIEELAGVDLICSDKTGTLTQNRLTLADPFCLQGSPRELLVSGALASRREDQDPIDLAVLESAPEDGAIDSYRLLHYQPFDPVSKRTESKVQGPDGRTFRVSKGAPQVILNLAADRESIADAVNTKIEEFAARGFRSLGVARTDNLDRWQFLGLLPLFDPPRTDSFETAKEVKELGVGLKMLTGDQLAIARETSRKLGLGSNILDAGLFAETRHHETRQLADAIEKADGFAQVYPEHKFHIVDVLQGKGHIVGMTGDGVNDAPALKKADAGIAVSGATDAARAAADIVLVTPGLSVIVDAIRESRRIFRRMESYATYRITETIRVLLFMTLSILIFNFYPVTAVMIVLLALLNDGAILSIAYDRSEVAARPVAWKMPRMLGLSTVLGLAGVIESFGLFYVGKVWLNLDPGMLQTLIYLKLSVAGHLTIFVTRTRRAFWTRKPATILVAAVLGTQTLATFIAVYGIFMSPIGWSWAILVWGYALGGFLLEDRIKMAALPIFDTHSPALFGRLRRWRI